MNSTQTEIWRPIPGWEGYYEASNHGRIRSVNRTVRHSYGRTRHLTGRVLKERANPQGRPMVNLCHDGKYKNHTIHSLIAATFIGPRPQGAIIRHLNDDPWDNRVENLAYGTPHENTWDCIRNGGHPELNKTHCPRGHELVEWNLTKVNARKGYRDCLACNRARAWMQRHLDETSLQVVSDRYFERERKAQWRETDNQQKLLERDLNGS